MNKKMCLFLSNILFSVALVSCFASNNYLRISLLAQCGAPSEMVTQENIQIGKNGQDNLAVNATSVFNSPVAIKDGLIVNGPVAINKLGAASTLIGNSSGGVVYIVTKSRTGSIAVSGPVTINTGGVDSTIIGNLGSLTTIQGPLICNATMTNIGLSLLNGGVTVHGPAIFTGITALPAVHANHVFVGTNGKLYQFDPYKRLSQADAELMTDRDAAEIYQLIPCVFHCLGRGPGGCTEFGFRHDDLLSKKILLGTLSYNEQGQVSGINRESISVALLYEFIKLKNKFDALLQDHIALKECVETMKLIILSKQYQDNFNVLAL